MTRPSRALAATRNGSDQKINASQVPAHNVTHATYTSQGRAAETTLILAVAVRDLVVTSKSVHLKKLVRIINEESFQRARTSRVVTSIQTRW